ncbi:MAG: MBL fold metallo-hydrolase [Bacteroidia bacterium]|nr:MBL fold metallo-hydrolase [Bacteroidia bacterium]
MRPTIYFLGAGGAHDLTWGNSSALLLWEGQKFLIDCGFTVYPKLVHEKLVEKIDAVCISHLHDDHIGSLSALLYHRHYRSHLPPLHIIVGTSELYAKLHTILHFLMGDVEKFARLTFPREYSPHLDAISTHRLHAPHMPSCAYLFSSPKGHLIYTGDISVPLPLLEDAEWISSHQPLWVFHDIAFKKNPFHCYYEDLYPYRERAHIWGYHCDANEAPENNLIPLVHTAFMQIPEALRE